MENNLQPKPRVSNKGTETTSETIELYRLFVERVKDYAIFLLDSKGIINTWNSGAQHIFGYKSEEIIGKHFSILFTKEDGEKKLPERELKTALSKGKAEDNNLLVRKDGTSFWVSGATTPLKDKQNKLQSFAKIVHDMSKIKALDERKDEFIQIAGHELKTPITSLKVYLQLLINMARKQNDETRLGYLSKMENQMRRLTALIDDLLDVDKIQANKVTITKHPILLDKFVKEVVEDFQGTETKHKIIVEGEIKRKVLADKNRLSQILTNLLTNAVKYSPESKRIIVRLSKDNAYAMVSVKDFGVGIDEEDKPFVFDRFFRAKSKKSANIPGLGLGLYICSEIIKRHGGKMGINSTKGKGSTFYFTLPIT